MARTRIAIAKADIVALFDEHRRPVFKRSELGRILEEHRDNWRLKQSMTLEEFIAYLLKNTPLRRFHFKLPHRPETVFAWGDVSPYCLASAVKADGYLSHYMAMHLHELTDQVPETIYVNHEQRPQPKPTQLPTQETIDRAFKQPQRTTKNIAPFGRRRLCVINGKHTGQLGVIDATDADDRPIRVSGIERTLIDVTVRPTYAGGVAEVLEAYRRAADRVQVNRLVAMLRKMDFTYPYQQAVGFYMERSGAFPEKRLDLLRTEEFEFDFYLTYAMQRTDYSKRWRLYFPTGL
ncbi:MAG: hypothetical protein IH983_09020 [Planctomycetes bacterium]|nr:hypothetical protein [Planctomycetota bacterium]